MTMPKHRVPTWHAQCSEIVQFHTRWSKIELAHRRALPIGWSRTCFVVTWRRSVTSPKLLLRSSAMTSHVTCRITVLSDRYWWTFVLHAYWRPLYCLFARLYKSPQQAVKNLSPHNSSYDWLRTEFDRPSPELSSARRSLAVKLDQVTKRKSAFRALCLRLHYRCLCVLVEVCTELQVLRVLPVTCC